MAGSGVHSQAAGRPRMATLRLVRLLCVPGISYSYCLSHSSQNAEPITVNNNGSTNGESFSRKSYCLHKHTTPPCSQRQIVSLAAVIAAGMLVEILKVRSCQSGSLP